MWNKAELTNRDLKMRSKHTKHSKKRLFNETIENNGTLSGVGCLLLLFSMSASASRLMWETKPKTTWDFNLSPFVFVFVFLFLLLQNSCVFGPAKGVYPDVHVVLYIPLKLNSLLNPLRSVIFLINSIRMTSRRYKSATSVRFLHWSHCSYMNSHIHEQSHKSSLQTEQPNHPLQNMYS